MANILVHSSDESVTLTAQTVKRLLDKGDGDAALLYLALLRHHGTVPPRSLAGELRWDRGRIEAAEEALRALGLITAAAEALPEPADERPAYRQDDISHRLETCEEFRRLSAEVEKKLGKKLTTPDVGILLGLYDDVGLPADVIYLLVNFCAERIAAQYGPGRRPTLRQIEREGYTWARLGLMDQHAASDYIRKYQRGREALPRLMALLRLGDRLPSPTEEKYLLSWNDMGFEDAVIELAYDRTMVNCKELKWPYINKILTTWHQNGLHTLQQVKEGDRPAPRRGKAPAQDENTAVRENLARMERYRDEMRKKREKEGS